MNLDPNRTVRNLATEVPGATRVFEKLGIDYCCGGGKSLRDACAQTGVSVEDVLRNLENSVTPQGPEAPDFTHAGLRDLVEHIVSRHHAYVKNEIPRIHQLAKKVASVHGEHHPELIRVRQIFESLASELSSHMMKEEQVLFPYIAQLETASARGIELRTPPFGTVANPVHMMELEHDEAGAALKELRAITGDYAPPDDACFSYKTLFTALTEFETDLHQHIHLENNILFPRAIELEQQAAGQAL